MHRISCKGVEILLSDERVAVEPTTWVLPRDVVPGMQGVICCKDDVAGGRFTILESVASIQDAAHPKHGFLFKYESLLPRVISISGHSENGQILFRGAHDRASDARFGKECSTDKLGAFLQDTVVCAEVVLDIEARPKNLEEIIRGQLKVYCRVTDSWELSETPYEIWLE